MLRTALALARKGLKVFPCLPRQKEPATEHGCKDASADPEVIRGWWRQRPDCNIAIATGKVSNAFVIDIDGPDAERALHRLEAEHRELPATVEVITPRPGRHAYFRMPDTPVRNSAGKIAPGVDVRGTGGYVLAPPSIHPSGRRYAWSVDSASAIAEAPGWLLARITERTSGNGQATPPSEWRALMMGGVDEGQRDNAVTRLCGYFLRHHVDALLVLETLQLWNAAKCRPPLPAESIERIVNSISNKELRRRHDHDGN